MKKTNAMRLLDSKKVRYEIREYEVDENDLGAVAVAAKTGVELDQIYKTLVLRGDKKGYIVACLGGDREVDLKALAKVSGNKKVEMIPMKDLEKLTGYVRGGCSPLGMKKLFDTYIDEPACGFDTIVVSGGRRGVQIELSPKALLELTRGSFQKISF